MCCKTHIIFVVHHIYIYIYIYIERERERESEREHVDYTCILHELCNFTV